MSNYRLISIIKFDVTDTVQIILGTKRSIGGTVSTGYVPDSSTVFLMGHLPPTWITESVPSFCGLICLGSCFRFAGHFQQTVLPLPQQYNGTCELSFIRSLLRHLNSRQPVTPQFVPSHQWKPTTSPERKNTGGIDMDTFNV